MDNPVQKWLLTVLKRILGVRDTTPSWCIMRECGLKPLQFKWFRAPLRLYNYLTQCNSTTAKKVLHADMRLRSRSDDCWYSHVFSAMTGLVQDYMFKKKLQNCEPIDVSRFVVDLRERHLDFWTPQSDGHPRERNSKILCLQWMVCITSKKFAATYIHVDKGGS